MFFLIFSLRFHNQEKRFLWDFYQSLIHQQYKWNRLDHFELVTKILFCKNFSHLTAFIYASLGCLHLIGPGKICKRKGGLHSRQSPFFLKLPSASRLRYAQVSYFHLLILLVLFEQPKTLQFTFGVMKNMY